MGGWKISVDHSKVWNGGTSLKIEGKLKPKDKLIFKLIKT